MQKTTASKPKSTRNPKSSLTQIVLGTFKVKKKKTLELNSHHHIEPLRTKVYRFGGMNHSNKNFFFLGWNLTISSFFSHPKRTEKMMKIKFSTKINVSRIRRINHLIVKKIKGLKCIFHT